MHREWTCVLAGGPHHREVVKQVTDLTLGFPPAVVRDEIHYVPMTTTARIDTEMGGCCVMAHGQASLVQVKEAHLMLLDSSLLRT